MEPMGWLRESESIDIYLMRASPLSQVDKMESLRLWGDW